MRIERVMGDAFGCLHGDTLDLAPGFTVVFGPNEAGKSTWHAAIYAALCGRRRGGGRRTEDQAFEHRYFPWGGDQWSVSAVVVLEDGTRVRMSQELAHANDCQAWDIGLNRDISDRVMCEGAPDASMFLGLDRKAFWATALVRQADLDSVRGNAKALQQHIQRAAATRGADATAAGAIAAVEDYLRERVGTMRMGGRRPLQAASDERRAAREALEQAKQQHEDLFVQEIAIEAERTQTRFMKESLGQLTARRDRERLAQLTRDIDRIEDLAARYPQEPHAPVVGDLLDRVRRAVAAWEAAPPPPDLSGASVAALEAEIEQLRDTPEGDLREHEDVVAAARDHEQAINELMASERLRPADPPSVETGGLSADELRQLASELMEPAPPTAELSTSVAPRSAGTWLFVVAGVLGLVGVIGLAMEPVLGAIGLAAALGALVGAVVLRRRSAADVAGTRDAQARARAAWDTRQANARARATECGLPVDPAQLRARARQLDDADSSRRALDTWQGRHDELTQRVEETRRHLAATLDDRGAPGGVDLDVRCVAYRAACERRRERARLEELLPTRRAVEESAHRRSVAAEGVVAIARECGIEGALDPDAAHDSLVAWMADTERALDTSTGAMQEWRELQMLVRDHPLEELQAERDRLAPVADAAEHDQLEIPMSVDELEAEIVRLTGEIADREQTSAHRQGALENSRRSAKSVTEAEERAQAADAELTRVQRLKDTLEVARAHLLQAQDTVNRNIAPVLQRSIEESLVRITGGKYTEVLVDPETLAISVLDATGKYRDVADLSHGTAEQVYLLLRVALAEHLTKDGEVCPLLLDEVTVQSDTTRTRAILELLHELSAGRQIVLFTQEDDVRDWAEDHLFEPQDRVVYV